MKKIEWDWYGTWIIDWLTCECDDPWKSYEIWEKAYLAANPEFEDLDFLSLVHDHYSQTMEPVLGSLLMKIWLLLSWPLNTIHSLIFRVRHYLLWRSSIVKQSNQAITFITHLRQ